MTEKPFFDQLADVEAILAEANELIPPQIEVGKYAHTIQVSILTYPSGEAVTLGLAPKKGATVRQVVPLVTSEIMPRSQMLDWITEAGRKLAPALDQQFRAAMAHNGYRID